MDSENPGPLTEEEPPNFTPKQAAFLRAFSASPYQSLTAIGREVGATSQQISYWKSKNDKFRAALYTEYRRSQQVANMNRKRMLHGMMEAIDMAKDLRQPGAMIAGWKEIARICGYYEPERREILLSVDNKRILEQIQTLPREKLLELMHEGSAKPAVEGEFDVVDAT